MTANELYHEKRKIIQSEIEVLKAKLESMDILQKNDSRNYGYAGNLEHVLIELQQLNYEFMEKY